MGTHSLIRVVWRNPATSARKVLCQYCHFDGDPKGAGKSLRDLLDLLPKHGSDGLSAQMSQLRVVYDNASDPPPSEEELARIQALTPRRAELTYDSSDDKPDSDDRSDYSEDDSNDDNERLQKAFVATKPTHWGYILANCQGQLARTLASGFFCSSDEHTWITYRYHVDLDQGRFLAEGFDPSWDFDLTKANGLDAMKRLLRYMDLGGQAEDYRPYLPIFTFTRRVQDRATKSGAHQRCDICNGKSADSATYIIQLEHEDAMLARSETDMRIPSCQTDTRNSLLLCEDDCLADFVQRAIVIEPSGRLVFDSAWVAKQRRKVRAKYAAIQCVSWAAKIDVHPWYPTSALLAWRIELREAAKLQAAAAKAIASTSESWSNSNSEADSGVSDTKQAVLGDEK